MQFLRMFKLAHPDLTTFSGTHDSRKDSIIVPCFNGSTPSEHSGETLQIKSRIQSSMLNARRVTLKT